MAMKKEEGGRKRRKKAGVFSPLNTQAPVF
jgi:hypothetical protein